jgi:hypothetical protein
MKFQWLTMRISEEKDRRERESNIQKRLASALDELRAQLEACVADYNAAFGQGIASLTTTENVIHVRVGEGRVDVTLDRLLPGFQVDRESGRVSIEVGILPGGNLFYRDAEKYLSMEEVTRRILDRILFPKLKD